MNALSLSALNWRRLAPGLLLLAALLLLFRDTAAAMVEIWIRSETFTHAFLVPPIVVWMAWRRREHLAAVEPRAAPWLLVPMAAICLLWMVGELAASNAVTQFALVSLIVLSVPAVFGLAVARELSFPLIFLFFAVPVGEFMVPMMMEWTADFTVAALQLTRIPVYREGLQFIIPSGNWSVVEACSGVRYLIASFMVGTLFAYLNFSVTWKRALFIFISLAVPVVANWLRAYMIVMLGHLSGNKLAAGVDHIIYGWVFFGLVIGIMFMVGARFADPAEPVPAAAPAVAGRVAPSGLAWGMCAAVVVLLLGTQVWGSRLLREAPGANPPLALPAPAAGWVAGSGPLTEWQPFFANPSLSLSARYEAGKQPAVMHVAYYRGQSYERKLVSSTNGLVEMAEGAKWAQVQSGLTTLQTAAGPVQLRTAVLRGSSLGGSIAAPRLRVWHLYWVGGRPTVSDARAKLMLSLNRLLGRGDDGAAIFLYTALDDENIANADALLQRFASAHLESLFRGLEAAHAAR